MEPRTTDSRQVCWPVQKIRLGFHVNRRARNAIDRSFYQVHRRYDAVVTDAWTARGGAASVKNDIFFSAQNIQLISFAVSGCLLLLHRL